jgi:hypothetical protein
MKKLSKRSIRLLQSFPRGFSIPCGFRLLKPKKGRLTAFCCARGVVYDITGELSTVRAPLCPRHRDFYLGSRLDGRNRRLHVPDPSGPELCTKNGASGGGAIVPLKLPRAEIIFALTWLLGRKQPVRLAGYRQLNGDFIAALECSCGRDPFTCPIDLHAMRARQEELRKS